MNRIVLVAAVGAAALALAAPASAAPKYFFSCVDGSKIQNKQPQDWSTTAPTASFTSGAGCGSADPGLLIGTEQGVEMDFYGGGPHTGPIQALNVELHSLLLTRLRLRVDPGVEVELLVDGEDVLGGPQKFRVTPVLSSTGLTEAYSFSISRKPAVGPDGSKVPRPLVAEDDAHTVSLRFSSQFLDYQNAWVWGASEVPSHVEVDPVVLTSPKVVVG